MDLFENTIDSSLNLLPLDGQVNYFGRLFSTQNANNFFDLLLSSIEWKNDEMVLLGNKIQTKRKVAWYGEEPFAYTYSNTTKFALPWSAELLELKNVVEQQTNDYYNSCLLNLYHDGNEGMTWHCDGEKELKPNGAIASLSFGAERKFSFKHIKTSQVVSLMLEHGSLLMMKGVTQSYWLHALPVMKKIRTPRINLTFRTILTRSL